MTSHAAGSGGGPRGSRFADPCGLSLGRTGQGRRPAWGSCGTDGARKEASKSSPSRAAASCARVDAGGGSLSAVPETSRSAAARHRASAGRPYRACGRLSSCRATSQPRPNKTGSVVASSTWTERGQGATMRSGCHTARTSSDGGLCSSTDAASVRNCDPLASTRCTRCGGSRRRKCAVEHLSRLIGRLSGVLTRPARLPAVCHASGGCAEPLIVLLYCQIEYSRRAEDHGYNFLSSAQTPRRLWLSRRRPTVQ